MSDSIDKRVAKTILVVDDDVLLLRAYAHYLGRSFRVVTAETTTEALAAAARETLVFAIVDVRLGGESGIDLVRELKARHAGIRVAMISASATLDLAVLATQSGADAVLSKPATVAEILQRLDADVPPALDRLKPPTLERIELEHIARRVADCDGNVKRAARELGISRSTLHRKLKLTPLQKSSQLAELARESTKRRRAKSNVAKPASASTSGRSRSCDEGPIGHTKVSRRPAPAAPFTHVSETSSTAAVAMRFLLETEICVYAIKQHSHVLQRILSHRRTELAISVITEAELRYGAAKSKAAARTLRALEAFLLPFAILDFTSAHAAVYAGIRSKLELGGIPIGPMDTLIAAQAVADKLVLVTNNHRELTRIPNLRVENWTT